MKVTEEDIVNLSGVLVQCLAFQRAVVKIENNPALYKFKLKNKINQVEKEANKLLDFWTDPNNPNSTQTKEAREICNSNLAVFYQVFDMIMMLGTEDITSVREIIIDKFLNKEEYLEKKNKINYIED
jgi:hypothetical protein|tara:strand:+ start:697 stop:1077 length:381 start_codon:yes stop_codon:yes gene_type:complete